MSHFSKLEKTLNNESFVIKQNLLTFKIIIYTVKEKKIFNSNNMYNMC